MGRAPPQNASLLRPAGFLEWEVRQSVVEVGVIGEGIARLGYSGRNPFSARGPPLGSGAGPCDSRAISALNISELQDGGAKSLGYKALVMSDTSE